MNAISFDGIAYTKHDGSSCWFLAVSLLVVLFVAVPQSLNAYSYDAVSIKRINCGGGRYIAGENIAYAADGAYTGSSAQGYTGIAGQVKTDIPIIGTSDQALYQSNRMGNVEYRFDLPVGVYDVTLKFAETIFNASGQRLFRVYLQDLDADHPGIRALDNFDIFAEAGGKNRAVDKTLRNITVNEGTLKIRFTSSYPGGSDIPLICAIEVKQVPYTIGDIGMSDEAFIDMVEFKAFKWFYENVEPPYYLSSAWGPNDNYGFVTESNISGVGFQIIVYCVGVYRGWMSYAEAFMRTKCILQAVQLMQKGDQVPGSNPPAYTNRPGDTYWHYVDRVHPERPMPEGDPVRSIFDNANLMMGMVFAQEYYRGTELEVMARQIYESLDWNAFGDQTWPDVYSENMIAFLLGASAPRASCRNKSMIDGFKNVPMTTLHNPLYYYQWFNNFFDGRNAVVRTGRNDFEYARNSTLANRQDFIDLWQSNPGEYNTYDPDTWGLTAATRSNGYHMGYNAGDVNPFAAAASMAFAPEEVLAAMKHMYCRFYKNGYPEYLGPIWSDRYGFCQTYNIGSCAGAPYFRSSGNGAFDYASVLFGIENFRTGFVWQHVMSSEYIRAGLCRIGTLGYVMPAPINLAENKPCVASSSVGSNSAENLVDDTLLTRWESDVSGNTQCSTVDLQERREIALVELYWDAAYAKSYTLQISQDGSAWTDAKTVTHGTGGVERHTFGPRLAGRYVRLCCTEKALPQCGYSLWGMKVFSSTDGTTMLSVTINNATLGLDISGGVDLGDLHVGETGYSSAPIWITNRGNVKESLWLSYANPPGMKGDATPGFNRFVLQAAFDCSGGRCVRWNDSNHLMSTVMTKCTAIRFAGGKNGFGIEPNGTRKLWFRFLAPKSITQMTTAVIPITVTASLEQ